MYEYGLMGYYSAKRIRFHCPSPWHYSLFKMFLTSTCSLSVRKLYIYRSYIPIVSYTYIYTYTFMYTEGPQIRSFPSTLFHYNIDEKNQILVGPLSAGVCTFSPCLRVFSPSTPVSSHVPKLCTWGQLACLHCPSPWECGCGYECALPCKDTLARAAFRQEPWVVGDAPGTQDPGLE